MPLFESRELGNYELHPAFSGKNLATALPVNIREMLGLPVKYKPYTGAYPAK